MTDWMRVTIACPPDRIADANELARCLGFSEADGQTFGDAIWQDAEGNAYAVASTLAKPAFAVDAMSPLVEPPWGADMTAAARAQVWLGVFDPASDQPPFASPVHIAAVIGLEPDAALAVLGVAVAPAD